MVPTELELHGWCCVPRLVCAWCLGAFYSFSCPRHEALIERAPCTGRGWSGISTSVVVAQCAGEACPRPKAGNSEIDQLIRASYRVAVPTVRLYLCLVLAGLMQAMRAVLRLARDAQRLCVVFCADSGQCCPGIVQSTSQRRTLQSASAFARSR